MSAKGAGTPAGPSAGLALLRGAAASGALDELAERHGLRALTVFGSAARGEPAPGDLDVGVIVEAGRTLDFLALHADLVELTGTEAVDLAHLNRAGPVLKERALVGSVWLYESEPGALARAATAATLERIDTRWLRDLDLELMAR